MLVGTQVTRIETGQWSQQLQKRKPLQLYPSKHLALEPILIPKLRIYFADFPYLHYSID